MQIRLRPRSSGLLTLMAERERRRPQDQAAVLVERALEAWFDEQQAYEAYTPAAPEEVDP